MDQMDDSSDKTNVSTHERHGGSGLFKINSFPPSTLITMSGPTAKLISFDCEATKVNDDENEIKKEKKNK